MADKATRERLKQKAASQKVKATHKQYKKFRFADDARFECRYDASKKKWSVFLCVGDWMDNQEGGSIHGVIYRMGKKYFDLVLTPKLSVDNLDSGNESGLAGK